MKLYRPFLQHPMLRYSKANIQSKQDLLEFMEHCCQCRHYSFDILKCGSSGCTFCKPPCLPEEEFNKLHHLPDPVIGDDHHYLPTFRESIRYDYHGKGQSAQKSKDGGRKFILKHVKNANIIMCMYGMYVYVCMYVCMCDQGPCVNRQSSIKIFNGSSTC